MGWTKLAVDDVNGTHLYTWGGRNCHTLAVDAINMLANTPWG